MTRPSPSTGEPVFERLSRTLGERGAKFDVLRHEPVFTSQQAADVRGTPLASGAKALVCKADERFLMFVLPADRRLASKDIRKAMGVKSLRFASAEEVQSLTGLAPGSIPPFGSLFDLATYCDDRLAEHERINFNAGDHSISISMTCTDYLAAEQPTLGRYGE
jgi:Ala-tRNA(Pro) deacylase